VVVHDRYNENSISSKIRAFMKIPPAACPPSWSPGLALRHAGHGICRFLRLLPWLAFLLAGGVAMAEKADRNKPMNVEADALRYDDIKQTSVFTGRVVLTKGTIVIRGGQLDVRQDAQGFQFGLVVAEPGKLAFFRQKREGVDEFIEGEGEVIEYDGRADTVKFIKKAQLRRFRGATLNDEMTGGVILYDNTTDVFTIDGGAARGTTGAPGGRVRAMLTPKPEASVPAPAASGAPAQQLAPVLRSTTTLGGEKK
jgi:lipopolysaccharide export system protein LptA